MTLGTLGELRQFEHDTGRPPRVLNNLVPSYLKTVPPTDMAAYPKFEYEAVGETPRDHFGNDWVVYVRTPSGPLNWDILLYLPNQRYPDRGYGGSLRRLGMWAYVHE